MHMYNAMAFENYVINLIVNYLRLVSAAELEHEPTQTHNTKMKVSIADGNDVALRGVCLIFMKLNLNTVITVQNVSQV